MRRPQRRSEPAATLRPEAHRHIRHHLTTRGGATRRRTRVESRSADNDRPRCRRVDAGRTHLADQVLSLGDGGVTRIVCALLLVSWRRRISARHRSNRRTTSGRGLRDGPPTGDAGVDFGVSWAGSAKCFAHSLPLSSGTTEGVSPRRAAPSNLIATISRPETCSHAVHARRAEQQFRKSSQQQLLVEMLLVRFALFDRALSIEDVLRSLGGGGSGGSALNAPVRSDPRSRPMERETRRAAMMGDAAPPVAASAPDAGVDWKSGYEETASEARRARLTSEAVRAERLAALRANDPCSTGCRSSRSRAARLNPHTPTNG